LYSLAFLRKIDERLSFSTPKAIMQNTNTMYKNFGRHITAKMHGL
jgi:hypothetical protein